MTAHVGSTLSLLVGIVTLRLALSNLMLNYVKPSMRIWLIAAGAILCFLGAIGFLRALRSGDAHHGDAQDNDALPHDAHDHPPSRAAWLLLLPILALSLITPEALGSFAAGRGSATRPADSVDWSPLADPINGAVELTLAEFNDRSFTDESRSLSGTKVRLIGFVTEPAAGSDADFMLNRFAISCCAADARTMEVEVRGAPAAPKVDSWVKITGVWDEEAFDEENAFLISTLRAEIIEPIAEPVVQYE